ncbi:MAG TPA: hypothetical protein DDZ90_31765, partial [Planctomycetaceae bacterium]|nr:hypothetical protein [Planctomycetaceae bacterium]
MKNNLIEFWHKRSAWRPWLILMLVAIFIFTYTFQFPLTLKEMHHNLPLILRFASTGLFLWGLSNVLLVVFPNLKSFQIKR